MDILDVIKNRRSVRSYISKEVSDELLYRIIEAGLWAPAAMNIQNTRVISVRDFGKKRIIADACLDQDWIADASIVLVICSEAQSLLDVAKKKGEFYAVQNSSAAVQNILLEAKSLGISSCWVGSFSESQIKDLLQIPPEVDVHSVVTLGYAKKIQLPPNRMMSNRFSFFEKWNVKENKGPSQLKEKIKKSFGNLTKKY